jgi:hypothetical protein
VPTWLTRAADWSAGCFRIYELDPETRLDMDGALSYLMPVAGYCRNRRCSIPIEGR